MKISADQGRCYPQRPKSTFHKFTLVLKSPNREWPITYTYMHTFDCIRENIHVPARFSPRVGQRPGLAGDSKPRGAPSRRGQVNSPDHGLSAGGLLGPTFP